MLRITENREGTLVTLKLAGRLAGEWTTELERCWKEDLNTNPQTSVQVDLAELTSVDETGKRLLATMAADGVVLLAADIVTQALVDQINEGLPTINPT